MGLPNLITIGRIFLIPIVMVFLLIRIPYGDLIAAAIFALAAVTDSLDGYIARSRKEITRLGIFLDPLADKLLVSAALITLVELHRVAAWIVVVIIAREFAVTGLRAIKSEEGKVIPASKWGKIKTVTQIIAILLVMITPLYENYISFDLGNLAMIVAAIITVISGIDYFKQFNIEEE